MNPLVNYKPNLNYWDVDSQLTTIGKFKDLYSNDKSKKKVDSSQIMWAIAFYCHPESKLVNYPDEEKKALINKDIYNGELDWNTVQDLINDYKDFFLTQAQRSLETWKLKLEERDAYLVSIPYKSLDLDDAKKLDALLADTHKLFNQYESIMEKISEESAKAIGKGGAKESASEKGLI